MAILVDGAPRRIGLVLSAKVDGRRERGRGFLDPLESCLDRFAQTYDRDLLAQPRLSTSAAVPHADSNPTNLATGNLFFFALGGGWPAEMGKHQFRACAAEAFSISRADAASSASPQVFAPLTRAADRSPRAAAVDCVTLTDGGFHDNIGVNPALRTERKPLEHLIIIDVGRPFSKQLQPTESGAVASLYLTMEQIRSLEFDCIPRSHPASRGPKQPWLGIDSRAGEPFAGGATFATSNDPDLTRPRPEQSKVPKRHRYALGATRTARFEHELLPASTPQRHRSDRRQPCRQCPAAIVQREQTNA